MSDITVGNVLICTMIIFVIGCIIHGIRWLNK